MRRPLQVNEANVAALKAAGYDPSMEAISKRTDEELRDWLTTDELQLLRKGPSDYQTQEQKLNLSELLCERMEFEANMMIREPQEGYSLMDQSIGLHMKIVGFGVKGRMTQVPVITRHELLQSLRDGSHPLSPPFCPCSACLPASRKLAEDKREREEYREKQLQLRREAELGLEFELPTDVAPLRYENADDRQVVVLRAAWPSAPTTMTNILGWRATISNTQRMIQRTDVCVRSRTAAHGP